MLFETENSKTSDKTFEELNKPHVLQSIGIMYCECVQKYLERSTRFPVHEEHKNYQKQVDQIRKFIRITLEQGAPFHVFMKAQFEILVPWMKKTGKVPWVSFSMLVSANAETRFLEWKKKKENQYFYRKEKTKAVYNLDVPQYRNMMIVSVNTLIHRLEFYSNHKGITEEVVLQELEMLARQGKLYDIYVWSHPLAVISNSEYLKKIVAGVDDRLTPDEKNIIVQIRSEINKVAEESEKKEIARYV